MLPDCFCMKVEFKLADTTAAHWCCAMLRLCEQTIGVRKGLIGFRV